MTAFAAPTSADGLALPRDFEARYGDGLRLGISLGGGGLFFAAWQVSYLHELAELGIDLTRADRVVGTSAGSIVASMLEAERLGLFYRELVILAKVPTLLGALVPSANLHPSQERAYERFRTAGDAELATIREIGHAALAAQTPAASVMTRHIGLIVASRKWPSPQVHLTCVDAYTGERCVVTGTARVAVARAVAASSAVPGLFAPQPIGDRRCMDGGVSGTGIHLDLLAGAERVVVLALTDGSDEAPAMMTTQPGSTEAEIDALRASGTTVLRRSPTTVDVDTLMSPATVPDAITMGRTQAAADADELREFLA